MVGAAIVVPFLGLVATAWFLSRKFGGSMNIVPDYKKSITSWLEKNLNDPEGLEILEWSQPQRTAKDEASATYFIVTVKFRAKNKFGAKEIASVKFKVFDGDGALSPLPYSHASSLFPPPTAP
jgi:hypothetical protein